MGAAGGQSRQGATPQATAAHSGWCQMTSEQIRAIEIQGWIHGDIGGMTMICEFLREIAAQLAELNDGLRKLEDQ
jgi:hypothetical protein